MEKRRLTSVTAMFAVLSFLLWFSVSSVFAQCVRVYTIQQAMPNIGIIDPVAMTKIGDIAGVGATNHNVFTSYDGKFLYVTADQDIVKVDIDDCGAINVDSRATLISSGHLAHVALTLDGEKLYISDGQDNVIVVDTETLAPIATINNSTEGLDAVVTIVNGALGLGLDSNSSNPHGLAIHPGGRYIYAPNIWSGSVTVIDTSIDVVVATLFLGHGTTPAALGFSTDGKWCFVSCAVPGYMCILNTSDPANPTVETTVAVGLSPIQVPANPTNRYFIAPCQTSSLIFSLTGSWTSPVPDPVLENADWIEWILEDPVNTQLALDLVQALLDALHDPVPGPTNDIASDACFVVEIDDNYDNDGIPWEVIDIVEDEDGNMIGPHGVSHSPYGQFTFVTNAQHPSGTVSVIEEIAPGDFEVTNTIDVGLFPNGIASSFGRNQNQ